MKISKKNLLIFSSSFWAFFLILSVADFNFLQSLNIIGFFSISIIPGLLTMFAFDIKGLNKWAFLCMAVAFSLLEIMIVGLVGNSILPNMGIARPLDKGVLLIEMSSLVAFLLLKIKFNKKIFSLELERYIFFDRMQDFVFAFGPSVFVILSIFGAIRLNNGGTNVITMFMLFGIGIYILLLLKNSEKIREDVIPISIFFLSLSLLLMTSLRGWFITGHDIQLEYKVFELSKSAGHWAIDAYHDPYNACLSITILPTAYYNLLKVSSAYIYKFIFQIFFALCPSIVYLISRQWNNKRISIMGVVFFMAFPTFFSDMPFLIRQEVSFLFYGLMLYIIFEKSVDLFKREYLFMIMGLGVILSHYSTTYIVLIIFTLATMSQPFALWIIQKKDGGRFFKESALRKELGIGRKRHSKISAKMVLTLLLLTFLWNSMITGTGGSVSKVLSETLLAIRGGFSGNNRSIDAASLLSFSKVDQNSEFQEYINNVVRNVRAEAPEGIYYGKDSYKEYNFNVVEDERAPLSTFSRFLKKYGIDIVSFVSILGQLLAKMIEFLAPVGVLYYLFRSSIAKKVEIEIYLIACFSFIFVLANVILPVLSIEYGIFRAMQQSLFVIAPFIIAGYVFIVRWLIEKFFRMEKFFKVVTSRKKKKEIANELSRVDFAFSAFFVVLFFLYSTAFIPQLTGGNVAFLHLNNSGNYYNNLLTQAKEVDGMRWFLTLSSNGKTYDKNNLPIEIQTGVPGAINETKFDIQTDKYSENKFVSITNMGIYDDIYPGLVRKDSYVFIGSATINKNVATILYKGDKITYSYPIRFLNINKNLVFNNGGARIYR
jgi:uncharacterized membrane protein